MGKVADPSPRKRRKVEALLKTGTMTQREIAESVCLSQKAVHTIKVRLDITGTSSHRSTSGRKLTVTPRVRRVLIMECKKNRKMTTKQRQGTLEQHNVKISTSCIRFLLA